MKSTSLFIGLLLLTGCAFDQTKKAADVLYAGTQIKYYYETGEVVDFVSNPELTEKENSRIKEAILAVERSRAIIRVISGEPKRLIMELDRVIYEYGVLRNHYIEVRNIVQANKKIYTSHEWDTLLRFDGAVQILDMQFSELKETAETNAMVVTAIRFADTVIKLAMLV